MNNKKTLGILSFAPLGLFIASFVLLFAGASMGIISNVGVWTSVMIAIMGTVISLVLTYAAMIYLLSWACRQSIFKDEDLQTWALMFYFLTMFIYPFFWWTYIRTWSEKEDACVERTMMSREEAETRAFLPLKGLGILIIFLFAGLVLEKIIPIAGVVIGWLWLILLGVLLFYTVWSEAKFLVEIAKSPYLSPVKKVLWTLFLYTFVFIALPVYWSLHLSNENGQLSRGERENIRKRNREFTRTRKREQLEKRRAEKRDEFNKNIDELSKGRAIAVFAILPGASLIVAIILMVYWMGIYTGYDGPIYVILCCMPVLLIGSGLIAWAMHMVSLWRDARHTLKDKILWTITMTLFNIFLFPIYWNKYIRKKNQIQEEKEQKHLRTISVLPCLLFAIFLVAMILENANVTVLTNSVIFEVVFVLTVVFFMVCYLFSFLVFSVKVLENAQFTVVKKVGWIAALLLVGIIADPLYCKRYVLGKNKQETD